jgi:hypothetical protein
MRTEERAKLYIDGDIMTTPPLIDTPESFIFCGGETEEKFATVSNILHILGRPGYIGENPDAASLYDLSLLTST